MKVIVAKGYRIKNGDHTYEAGETLEIPDDKLDNYIPSVIPVVAEKKEAEKSETKKKETKSAPKRERKGKR